MANEALLGEDATLEFESEHALTPRSPRVPGAAPIPVPTGRRAPGSAILACTALAVVMGAVLAWPGGETLAQPAEGPRGSLSVSSQLPASVVLIDGVNYGVPPVVVPALPHGRYHVTVRSARGETDHVVDVAGDATSLVVVEAPASPAGTASEAGLDWESALIASMRVR